MRKEEERVRKREGEDERMISYSNMNVIIAKKQVRDPDHSNSGDT